jgi:single-stranded DNA-binding protein
MSKNKVEIEGTVAREPRFGTTNGGKQVCNIRVHSTEPATAFTNCVAWENEAVELEGIQEGDTITLEGHLTGIKGRDGKYTDGSQVTITKLKWTSAAEGKGKRFPGAGIPI